MQEVGRFSPSWPFSSISILACARDSLEPEVFTNTEVFLPLTCQAIVSAAMVVPVRLACLVVEEGWSPRAGQVDLIQSDVSL